MEYILLIKCIFSGFFLAAPIGPVNLICIRRTLNYGYITGLAVGMGAAMADTLYGYAAAAGLSFITDFILHYHFAFRWGGGLFIIYLGLRTLRTAPQCLTMERTSPNLYRMFAGIFLLTLTNPITVFAFLALFSSLGIAVLITDFFTTVLAAVGVFIGSTLWWITLTSIVYFFRNRVTSGTLVRINKIAGSIIILLGIVSLFEL
ncbi:LysE family translocator [Sporomusa sp.]|uniref:LysE family translocator n=1 Tax=Sporomusa sp. TaxID=2078658 RepID=UPI002D156D88|nr:LysE family transporter [Sporomusa sp.]HWR10060.1 LysE family transporter [Sporomusa sp.]